MLFYDFKVFKAFRVGRCKFAACSRYQVLLQLPLPGDIGFECAMTYIVCELLVSLGQIVEWPEVITEGVDIDDCRVMLQDALKEMILAYVQVGQTIPAI